MCRIHVFVSKHLYSKLSANLPAKTTVCLSSAWGKCSTGHP